MEQIMLLILGLIIVVLGVVNCSGNISTIHYYNRRKVKKKTFPNMAKRLELEQSSSYWPSWLPSL